MPATASPRELKVEDALAYLEKVKRHYAREPAVFNAFLGIMTAFKAREIDTFQVVLRVWGLFRGHEHLVRDLNTFLPPGCFVHVYPVEDTGAVAAYYVGGRGVRVLPRHVNASATPRTAPARRRDEGERARGSRYRRQVRGAHGTLWNYRL